MNPIKLVARRFCDLLAYFSEHAQGGLVQHLSERELAQRWRFSVRTLQRWRDAGTGPVFLKIGHRIAYRLSDIEKFEREHIREGRS